MIIFITSLSNPVRKVNKKDENDSHSCHDNITELSNGANGVGAGVGVELVSCPT